MDSRFDAFLDNLKQNTPASPHTSQVYLRDVAALDAFLGLEKDGDYETVTQKQLEEYFSELKQRGRSDATLARVRSSLSRYYAFLMARGIVAENLPRRLAVERHKGNLPAFLTLEQVRHLLASPQGESFAARRDRAILHVLYATGLKSAQLTALNTDQVLLERGLLHVPERPEPFLPLYPQAVEALRDYLGPCRGGVLSQAEEPALFLNAAGKRLTRQGLWKILGRRGKEAGLSLPVTPQLLRVSLAVHLAEKGATAEDLKALLGLEDPYWVQVYFRTLEGEQGERYRRLHPLSR